MGQLFCKICDEKDDAKRRAECLSLYDNKYRSGFREVTDVTAEEILRIQRTDGLVSVLLVDCRSDEEIAVSKLPGSVSLEEFDRRSETLLAEGSGKTEVIMYCTIGARSGSAARDFGAKFPGVKVANFRGSLIEWSHAGGEVVDTNGRPTRRIHACARKFGNMMPERVEVVV
mmetsp:Transcript_44738/g.87720  ORF Transcript_44738/g.87720 Transcript_44738/m.87720 type:complete len:172 (-) Transcript_44738:66-581(-)